MILGNIKAMCTDAGITLAQLERELNFGNGTISTWSKCSPSAAKLKAVADYFGCTIDDFFKED